MQHYRFLLENVETICRFGCLQSNVVITILHILGLVKDTQDKKKNLGKSVFWRKLLLTVTYPLGVLTTVEYSHFDNVLKEKIPTLPLTLGISPNKRLYGFLIDTIGTIITAVSYVTLGSEILPFKNPKTDIELVTHGPYRYIRHPIYLGLILHLLGSSLMTNRWLPSIFNCLSALLILSSIPDEEDTLIEMYDEKYLNYMNLTRALLWPIF
eukprot:TRINITY_DN9816_c0_g1_i2.p1 TRINITY_DN9816_c0_g1~~TRINITY_DN9816_c0_g1_i2.p1  ORF type:complete len:211 (-),score=16.78 TRINITY_DN9816_c0_g1_i2:114-746(-)